MPPFYPHRLFSRLGLGLAVLLGSAGLVLATTLSLFTASYTGSAVRVEWEVSTETDLTCFNLSRKLPDEPDYSVIGSLHPTGQLRYSFADTCLAQGRSGLLPGPVARTWGTIKAMFR